MFLIKEFQRPKIAWLDQRLSAGYFYGMAKLLVLLFVLAGFMSGTFDSHAAELCANINISMDHEGPIHNEPQDCSSSDHHHHCCHQPLNNGSGIITISGPLSLEISYVLDDADMVSSPFLEGPFQPPKA